MLQQSQKWLKTYLCKGKVETGKHLNNNFKYMWSDRREITSQSEQPEDKSYISLADALSHVKTPVTKSVSCIFELWSDI